MATTPVLNTEALAGLGEQLGDDGILHSFLHRYLAMLGRRIDRLESALRAADHAASMDAVLSLKTSSALAGAQALAELSAALQEEYEQGLPALSTAAAGPWAQRIRVLRETAEETACQLRSLLCEEGFAGAGAT
ncbi:hypothetical protein [Brachybacterium epidermidis]|uniref:hypothetical protein n=1 Tax=Brachybacterium epidermidis TaxID=2781983 RepID=UPI00398E53E0